MQFLSYSMFGFILSLKNLYTLSSIFYKQQIKQQDQTVCQVATHKRLKPMENY